MATVALLEEDPDLAADLPPEELAEATRVLTATTLDVPAGPWDVSALRALRGDLLGAFVLDGLLQRATAVSDRRTIHPFGPGDLVRPWDDDDLAMTGRTAAWWEALEASRVALLDRAFIAAVGRYPSVLIELSRRHAAQSSRIQLQATYVQLTRVDDRVLMHFWRLGQRWGRMRRDGILVPIPLTHARIAELVGARRPPVSTALGRLAREGLLQRVDDGWLIAREAEEVIGPVLGPVPDGAGH
jgi:CRP/FNR family cyclic AMP-dependent transcriptional regulator